MKIARMWRMREWEARLISVADENDGLGGRCHLPAVDLDRTAWRYALRSSRWEALSTRVLRSRSAPKTQAQRLRAAVLDAWPGAFFHAESALGWLGLEGYSLAEVQLCRMRGVSNIRPELGVIHNLRAVRGHHLLVHHGLVTENACRAIWSIAAGYASPRRFELGVRKIGGLLDHAHREGLVTWAGLHEMVDDIRQRGRAGTRVMRACAASRPPGSSPTESRQEQRFEEVLDEANVRRFRRQVVTGGHEPIGRVDFADDDLPLLVEVNSLKYHTAPTDRARDERRYEAFVAAGFTVLVVWEDDLWRNPQAVVDVVHRARRYARRRRAGVVHSPGCPWPRPRVAELVG